MAVDDDYSRLLRRAKVSEEDIEAARSGDAQRDEAVFDVHEDAWESWTFFLKVNRQWVFVAVSAGMGVSSVRTGLNWPGIEAVIRLSGVKRGRWAGLVDDLMVIEEAVLEADSEARR